MNLRVAALAASLAVGCQRPLPTPPVAAPAPPAPAPVVPSGCEAPLSGTWVHRDDTTWRYVAHDDGGTATFEVFHDAPADGGRPFRRFGAVDAGAATATDAGAPSPRAFIELHRTPAGFVGHTHAEVTHPSGQRCTVAWPTQGVACGDGGLVVRTARNQTLDDACQPSPPPSVHPQETHVLLRVDDGPTQSGP